MRSRSRYGGHVLSHVWLQRLTGQTLTVFLDHALGKKYLNPSSDILSVLAGLHDADQVMSEFVGTIDVVIRNGRSAELRLQAIRTALMLVAASFHTGLPSYFTHRDLFPALMKVRTSSFSLNHAGC